MKLNKKTIIILIIVAVAGYLIWKRMKEKGVSVEDVNLTASPDKTSLNYILTHVDFNATERNKIEKYRQAAEASEMTYQSILGKANATGRSYDQQLVLNALWMLYHPGDNWTTDRGWKLQQEVLQLNGQSLW